MVIFLFSLILGFSSKNFFIFWVRLEMSGLCMVVLFWKKFYSSQTFTYFLITAFRGAFLFFSWIKSWYFLSCLVLFVKIGIWPFRYWVINVCQKLSFLRGFIFLFLLKFLPFFGIFKYFTNFSFFLVFTSLINLVGATYKLFTEMYFSIYKIFLWMSIRSVSYWVLIGLYSFYFFLVCYSLYSVFMFLILYKQRKNIVKFHLWMLRFLLFLGGPPLLYLFFKIFFFCSLPKKFFFMGCLTFIFFFQSMILIRVLIFSRFRTQKIN